jgi:TPR repeat protein
MNPGEKFLSASLAALALAAFAPAWQPAHAQGQVRVSVGNQSPAQLYVAGQAMERRKDEKGAFIAYLEAAEGGYPPAQRRLGEIYDSGNSAVERNYSESIRWYEKAREGGEIIPPPIQRVPNF